jgi:hypothetical protein
MMDQGKKKGKSREQGKKREISENRKESKKDKTCKNLYPFGSSQRKKPGHVSIVLFIACNHLSTGSGNRIKRTLCS